MLVEVIQLRLQGRKLSRLEIGQARKHYGRLHLHDIRPGTEYWGKQRPLLASLCRFEDFNYVIEPLDFARVTRIRDQGMVIVGMQADGFGKQKLKYPQAWWVRPFIPLEAAGGVVARP